MNTSTPTLKTCARCRQAKPLTAFYAAKTKDGRRPYCIPCALTYAKAWRQADPAREQRQREHAQQWNADNKERKRRTMKAYYQKYKATVIDHYSNGPRRCACCGVTDLAFLAIDHIHGGGNKHRKTIKTTTGTAFYLWLIRNNFPEGFRVLCHNCNFARGAYGVCPHEQERAQAQKESASAPQP